MLISELTLQDGETVDAQWVTLERLDELIRLGEVPLPVVLRLQPLRSKLEAYLYSRKDTE